MQLTDYRAKYFAHELTKRCAIFNGAVPAPADFPEQHRTVARINQLTVLCNMLEQQVEAATSKQAEQLNATMSAQ